MFGLQLWDIEVQRNWAETHIPVLLSCPFPHSPAPSSKHPTEDGVDCCDTIFLLSKPAPTILSHTDKRSWEERNHCCSECLLLITVVKNALGMKNCFSAFTNQYLLYAYMIHATLCMKYLFFLLCPYIEIAL